MVFETKDIIHYIGTLVKPYSEHWDKYAIYYRLGEHSFAVELFVDTIELALKGVLNPSSYKIDIYPREILKTCDRYGEQESHYFFKQIIVDLEELKNYIRKQRIANLHP